MMVMMMMMMMVVVVVVLQVEVGIESLLKARDEDVFRDPLQRLAFEQVGRRRRKNYYYYYYLS